MKQLLSVLAALALLGAPAQAVTEADFASCGAYNFGFIRAEACIDALDGDYTLNLGPTTVPFGPYQLREQAEYEVFGSLLTVEVNSNVRAFTGLSVFSQAKSFHPEALRITGFGELSAGVNAVFGGFKAELPEDLQERLPTEIERFATSLHGFVRFDVAEDGLRTTYGAKANLDF